MIFSDFITRKTQLESGNGFAPISLPDSLFDFQKSLVDWALRQGRAGIFADCGMGKTPMQLSCADNIVRKTNGRVLLATTLGVSHQTVAEGAKFGIECQRSRDGKPRGYITVTNYDQLHKFDPADFVGVVCDESSILKSFDGAIKGQVTDFMRKVPYRSLWTATAAPNDYIELGTSSEALGYLGHVDMLNRFFTQKKNFTRKSKDFYGQEPEWRFKGHAESLFWRWIVSWARAVRHPRDLGFDTPGFDLPPLIQNEHLVDLDEPAPGTLFTVPAATLWEQREERKRTLQSRCERAASLVNGTGKPFLVWCHMNDEGNLLEKLIPDAVQVSGADKDEAKEEKLMAFASGKVRGLITKPVIGAWGLNFQHCAHEVYFPSHSYEQFYQAIRRCWRFGQKNPVTVDLVLTPGERRVQQNLSRKAEQAETMFAALVAQMNDALSVQQTNPFTEKVQLPSWL